MKLLSTIQEKLNPKQVIATQEVMINGVTTDSRKVTPGGMFICLRGVHTDGHEFANQAVEAGAAAVVTERKLTLPETVTQFIVDDSRTAMQKIIPFFYDYPADSMRIIGVTGTNGKTTVTHMIAHLLRHQGAKIGLLGTVHVLIGDKEYPTANTTPDVDVMQYWLAKMKAEGVTHVIMEVSSHALVLGRVAGISFDVAVFTNLTQDHLDFHKTMAAYAKAKQKLFTALCASDNESNTAAVINIDDPYGQMMALAVNGTACDVVMYGMNESASVRAKDIIVTAAGSDFVLVADGVEYPCQTAIMGMFNIYNMLAAIAVAHHEGMKMADILVALRQFRAVAGRFERIDEGKDFAVIVDYAHTPDGLEKILRTAREMTAGRVLITFGCGGDRDSSKRPIMGKIAAQYANVVWVTSDNPRTEDPERIIDDVYEGCVQGKSAYTEIHRETDRHRAIARVIEMAQTGDVVLIAGKGHEDYQIIGEEKIHFDDREEARKVLRRL